LTGLYPRLHGTGERAPGIAGGPPPGHFSFKFTEGRRFLRTYLSDLESLPERLLEAGYSTKMVASNPLCFLSGLARDGFEIAVRARVSPGSSFPELARRLLLSSDPDVPLFLLVHCMDPHEWEDRYVDLFGPDADPSAAEADRSVSLADLTPTILDVAGVHYDADTLSGESLLQPPFATNRLQFADYQLYGSELASVRQGDHKLVIDLESGNSELWHSRGAEEYLEVDDARLTEDLMKAYQAYLSAARTARQDLELPDAVDDDEALDALKELGYVQ